jgi:hypothetical protein
VNTGVPRRDWQSVADFLLPTRTRRDQHLRRYRRSGRYRWRLTGYGGGCGRGRRRHTRQSVTADFPHPDHLKPESAVLHNPPPSTVLSSWSPGPTNAGCVIEPARTAAVRILVFNRTDPCVHGYGSTRFPIPSTGVGW